MTTINQGFSPPLFRPKACVHTSPGHAPWVHSPTTFYLALKARFIFVHTPQSASIPNIPFVELHLVFAQQISVLFLEGSRAMMFLLVVDVLHQVLQLAPTDRKIAVASLPMK